ncbi:calmodulin-binding transcription activator 4-like isoform X2 [Papaver somniferum]|uniref:calmodulin-binding transcription activator 4-like isoform X2 n=1 Tax=Papaver somniferum TaxID=3469 RepID=UPI000E6FCDA9|nr:calmodulin-binding transcription activator 4-like isoform X2 [Papaver somniferum]
MNDPDREYDIDTLIQEARVRWLKPVEIQFILLNHDGIYPFTEVVPQNPQSGSLFLINKNVTKSFRKDGHNWKKKRSGRTVAEGHERLKVGGVEVLSCYYAQGAENPNLRRRIYWMLDAAYDHIVLVHHRVYTDINEGRRNTEASSTLNLTSTSNPGFQTASIQAAASAVSESYGTYQNPSPFGSGSMDVIPDLIDDNNLFGVWDSPEDICSLMDAESIRAEQRMLDDLNGKSTDTDILLFDQDELLAVQPAAEYRENVGHSCEIEKPQSSLERDKYSTDPHKHNEEYSYQWQDPSGNNTQNRNIDIPIFGDTSNFHPIASTQESSLLYAVETQLAPVEVISRLTVAQCQKFSIQEISPEWGYASECSKVIITGLFHCNSSAHSWKCMFGDVEVPVEIVQEGVFRRQTPPQSPGQVTFIQEGVLRCYTPPKSPGKVTLCITTGNREACSQIREFEYCTTPTASIRNNNLPKTDGMKSAEELQLLIRFVQMLLCDSSTKKKDGITSGTNALEKLIADEYLWENLKHAVLVGSESESRIMDSLLQELLKEKLPQWLHSRFKEGESPGSTSLKKEQEIIHLVAGLGFEWALNLILSSGIGINFRDTKGWTALHHAANFGREEMVVALIVAGASAGAVTDPTPEDPVGKTPGSIAISRGHKGVAGYLSELALTSHLRSLTLEENDLTKGRSDVEAEIEVESLSIDCTDDHHSLRQSLTAVRNAALAAARIQNAFRAHSFRKRKQKEDLVSVCDEFGITAADIPALSATSKMGFPKLRDRVLQNAAVVIQKKYRGWSGQRTFLELKRKIILIQAHVRGHQVRRKLFRWAVGILEKVLLRWRRKRVGLRGLRQETESADASDDEDILKVFRKKKVDVTVERAVSWVVSMAHSRGARGQYCRLLESYRQQVKVESCTETSSASRDDSDSMETNNNDDFFRFPL